MPVTADAGVIGTTEDNLKTAADEELSEGVDMYIEFAKVAEKKASLKLPSISVQSLKLKNVTTTVSSTSCSR